MEGLFDKLDDNSSVEDDNINKQYQQRLFEKIRDYRLRSLAGYVQNDFKRMLEDGTATKQGIKDGIQSMEANFDRVIKEITKMREQCKTLMEYYSE